MARCTSLSHPFDAPLSRLLAAFVVSSGLFALVPGIGLGIWSLAVAPALGHSVPTAWSEAHGHAQLFGWIGSAIFGVALYTIPRLRRVPLDLRFAWVVWWLWSGGVAAVCLAALFRPALLMTGTIGELLATIALMVACFAPPSSSATNARISLTPIAAAFLCLVAALLVRLIAPLHERHTAIAIAMWGFVVVMIWSYAARWLPATFGLREFRSRMFWWSVGFMMLTMVGMIGQWRRVTAVTLLMSVITFILALRIFEPAGREAKLKGPQLWLPFFVRLAHGWLLAAAILQALAAWRSDPFAFQGASRHALLLGYVASMLLAVAPRFLPSFLGAREVFSGKLMITSLALLHVGTAAMMVTLLVQASSTYFHFGGALNAIALITFFVNMGTTALRGFRLH